MGRFVCVVGAVGGWSRTYAVATVPLPTPGDRWASGKLLGDATESLRWGHAGPLTESSLAFSALWLEPSLQRGAVLALVGFPRQPAVWQPGFDVSSSVRRRWVCLPFRLGVAYGGG